MVTTAKSLVRAGLFFSLFLVAAESIPIEVSCKASYALAALSTVLMLVFDEVFPAYSVYLSPIDR